MAIQSNAPIATANALHAKLNGLAAVLHPRLTNWSQTTISTPPAVLLPRSTDEIKQILTRATEEGVRVRIIGSRFCMNGLWTIDPGSYALSLENMKEFEFAVDARDRTATIPGQITVGETNTRLAEYGLTLPTMGSVSGPTIAGCISTCTHGTGVSHSTVSSYVQSLTIVLPPTSASPTARVLTVGRDSQEFELDLFKATLCGLGCTGVIVAVTIKCAPLEQMTECTTPLPNFSDTFIDELEERARAADRVRLWWTPATGRVVQSSASSASNPSFGTLQATPGSTPSWWRTRFVGKHVHQCLLFLCSLHPLLWRLHPYALSFLFNFSHHGVQGKRTGLPGKVQEMDCLYAQRTTEYSILGFDSARAVLRDLKAWFERPDRPHEMNGMVEIRFAAADDIPLSPVYAHAANTVFVDIGLVQYVPFVNSGTTKRLPYEPMEREFERICRKHGGRVHWAKETVPFSETLEKRNGLKAVEEMWGPDNQVDVWVNVVRQVDPKGIFWNQWLEDRLSGVHL
ncbi:FAD-binding domain-containing protein [Punctularia strigosozonata HHB-11173 SS5]|uniref:FAD-binding domain-containing protein n=1 Tax=Punctularia strigosozonata (strain HHB-11173) TaxID=741275 RepID=UPI000441652E|nr:FAD-binding domain-containing protein [Punctularia strigosozonata HHB-11173 SS5]EIN14608.1 FAD-binding domain-containing protein [Punctularia strigosozonata HHB-11173 SS5]